ncbi:PorP/SprF family type IX secretion system membrane protein [Chitinophaga qingshengii]|uniref:PorP/SprF family type IX secretion system membrane protein n=1 Tax=Chitinophaga qingshengii TaxID=1569794 RepID=A0ABR7TFS4_9BACT|nr:PorP/SprF family type IX secretion system membrane protein [Chitinophaga qingshengii]MBC9929207.1 PorP/SprF family type IX secretion system membrane protein [Chitinophaga qingshengii]
MKRIFLSLTKCISLLLLTIAAGNAAAQTLSDVPALLEPSGTQYFQNAYLANAAMAGIDTGLHINAAYRRQAKQMTGAPETRFLTVDGLLGKRVGAGLNVMNDVAGLINRTRVAMSYAYHLPIGKEGQQLHFGLSLAMNFQRLDLSHLNGDPNDPTVGAFNRRDNYFEGEYGMAYTNGALTVQAALPNIRSMFTNDKTVNGGTIFYSAAEYRFAFEGALESITPKVCYRGVRGYNNILDIGVNAAFLDNVLNVMALYHSSRSFTAGFGVDVKKTVLIQALYHAQTGGYNTYNNGTYEIGAGIHLFK